MQQIMQPMVHRNRLMGAWLAAAKHQAAAAARAAATQTAAAAQVLRRGWLQQQLQRVLLRVVAAVCGAFRARCAASVALRRRLSGERDRKVS
jgi:hypothetical protein